MERLNFERAILKIQCGSELNSSLVEERSVRRLRAESASESDTHRNIALKKAFAECRKKSLGWGNTGSKEQVELYGFTVYSISLKSMYKTVIFKKLRVECSPNSSLEHKHRGAVILDCQKFPLKAC